MKKHSAAFLLALAPAVLLAGEEHGGMLERWDADGNGTVSREEARTAAAERVDRHFDALDANRDGNLTREEFEQARQQRRAAMQEKVDGLFAQADSDGDGSLSKEEAEKGMPFLARHFERLDADGNGAVTRAELQAHHDAHHRHSYHEGR